MSRPIDADKLHYHTVRIVNKDWTETSAVVVFAEEIDKLARKTAKKAEGAYRPKHAKKD